MPAGRVRCWLFHFLMLLQRRITLPILLYYLSMVKVKSSWHFVFIETHAIDAHLFVLKAKEMKISQTVLL